MSELNRRLALNGYVKCDSFFFCVDSPSVCKQGNCLIFSNKINDTKFIDLWVSRKKWIVASPCLSASQIWSLRAVCFQSRSKGAEGWLKPICFRRLFWKSDFPTSPFEMLYSLFCKGNKYSVWFSLSLSLSPQRLSHSLFFWRLFKRH